MDIDKRLLLFLIAILLFFPVSRAGAPTQSLLAETPVITQENSLMPAAPSYIVHPQILASLVDESIRKNNLQDEIELRESNGDPRACNLKYGCRSGMGLCMFISSTWNETLDRMMCRGKYQQDSCIVAYLPEKCDEKVCLPMSKERSEMIFNPECHRLVCAWLLKKDGIIHWDEWSGPYDLSKY